MSKKHELKVTPEHYTAFIDDHKTFEIRKNDRDYQVGDWLYLREWTGEEYTGNTMTTHVRYISEYMQKDGFVVMGIR